MASSIRVGQHAELEDSPMDRINNKADFRGLKMFVKDLDLNTLPPFLARVCDPIKPCSFSEEEILCIFETAAEAHGRKIAPQISQIISTLVRIMLSVAVPLQNVSCSKVVCTLSRYVIDPLAIEEDKTGVIGSICRPLSDCLMSSMESVSSGCALCVTALVQSNSWQFASNELVNDACLKVAGALEEAHGQTVAHLNLVVALSKKNPFTLEPYGRSLIRSGLHILDGSTKASIFQMIIPSIQMIHSIMKSLDLSIISSEISSIIHAMEQFQDDCMPDISTAAFQASETAKLLGRQKESGNGNKLSQLANYSGRHSRRGSYSHSPADDVDIRDKGSIESLSCELQPVHLFTDYDSQPSVGQCLGASGSTHARRCLWVNESPKSHQRPKDDFFRSATPDSHHDDLGLIAQSYSSGLVRSSRRFSELSTRLHDPCITCSTPRATNQCSQISRRRVPSGDIRMQSTPRKQLHSCTFCRDPERDGRQPESPALRQIQRCSGHCGDGLQFEKDSEVEERNGYYCRSIQQDNQYHEQNTDVLIEDLKLPPNGEHSDDGASKSPCQECQAKNDKMIGGKRRNEKCFSNRVLLLVCVVVIIIAFLLAWWKEDNKEPYAVPT